MKKEWIIKHINGELTAEERIHVEQWITADARHEKEYLDMKEIWELSGRDQNVPEVDIDHAWTNFVRMRDEHAEHKEAVVQTMAKRKIPRWSAAVAVGVLGILFIWWLSASLSDELHLETFAQTQRSILPDGSGVSLNRNTSLHYRKNWLSKKREIHLQQGEAFFDVKKDKDQPFVIESGNTHITVLGTSFHVRREAYDTEVIVVSGSVKVSYSDKEVVLKPEQMITLSDTSKSQVRIDTVPDHLYRYYVHQEFVFENTPLSRVFALLGKAYDVQFVINEPAKEKLPLSATFEQQTFSEMLHVIVHTFQLKVEKKGNTYYIN